MTSRPLISAVIPSYNSGKFVAQAVQSALTQTYAEREVVVVDDGSTDDTRAVLAPFMDRIRYVYQPNGGLSRARNRGIEVARGELIAFLDADDVWLPDKLTRQWECLQRQPDAGMVHTDVYQLYEPQRTKAYLHLGKERYLGSCYPVFFRGNHITVSSVMVTRPCLEQIGLFDEKIAGPSTQDMDLWLRIARFFPVAYVDEPLVLYRHHVSNGSHNQRMMHEDEHYVLDKALRADPTLWQTLGRETVRWRMSALAVQAGHANVEMDDLRRARRYYREALSYRMLDVATWAYGLSTFLPLRVRKKLRRTKQGLAGLAGSRRAFGETSQLVNADHKASE